MTVKLSDFKSEVEINKIESTGEPTLSGVHRW